MTTAQFFVYRRPIAWTALVATLPSEGAVTEATVGYSIGLWHLLNGRPDAARTYFQRAVDAKLPTSWGARAAEAELRRMGTPPTNP